MPGGSNDALIAMVGGVIVAALGTLGLILAEVIKGRNARTTVSPPAPTNGVPKDIELYQRTAVFNDRLDDRDKRFDIFERQMLGEFDEQGERIERIERHLGIYEEGGHH